jgi:hypothetical protein
MVFVSTGGEKNTSQVLHGSLFTCRNENEALVFTAVSGLPQPAALKNNRRPHIHTDAQAILRFLRLRATRHRILALAAHMLPRMRAFLLVKLKLRLVNSLACAISLRCW